MWLRIGLFHVVSAGNAAFSAGKYAKAVEHYSLAIKLESKDATVFSNRAAAHFNAGVHASSTG